MRRPLWSAVCVVAACGPSLEQGATFEEHALAREEAAPGPTESIALPAALRDVVVHEGAVLLATDAGVFLQRGNDAPLALQPLSLEDGEPATSGAARAIAVRPSGAGLVVAAEAGLYLWSRGAFVRSPLSALVVSPRLVASGMFGGEERVVAFDGGRLVVAGGAAREVALEPVPENVRALAYFNGTVFLADGSSLLLATERGDGFAVTRTDPDAGEIRALAVDAEGALWLAAEGGLLRRTESFGTVAWTLWPLDGGAHGLAFDPDGAGVWVRVKAGAIRVDPRKNTGLVAPIEGSPGPLAMDAGGQLWALDAGGTRVLRRGGLQAPAPSFAAQVEPFSRRHCASCHAAGSSLPLVTREEWETNAERILLNLEVGTMPRGNSLPSAEYRVVERWVSGGMLP